MSAVPVQDRGMAEPENPSIGQIRLRQLRLSLFRNHGDLDLEIDARPVVICGPNGLGKTNVLEAVSLLTPGRGLRQARFADMAGQGGDGGFSIFAQIEGPSGPSAIGTGITADAPDRRVVRIDGVAQSASGVLGNYVRALWLTPDMDRLFVDPAATRRRFLDRLALALDPAHAAVASAYDRAMRQRNRLMRDAKAQGTMPDPAWMQVLERQMAQAGTAMARGRQKTVTSLRTAVAATGTGPFPRPDIRLDGLVEGWLETGPHDAAADRFADVLARGRAKDVEAGRTLDGPHTSDLAVRHAAKDQPAHLCSTGEQKALLIALVLAHARTLSADGFGPLLLLDEVAAHLDHTRRAALFDVILDLKLQAWMTGTDALLFDSLGTRARYLSLNSAHH